MISISSLQGLVDTLRESVGSISAGDMSAIVRIEFVIDVLRQEIFAREASRAGHERDQREFVFGVLRAIDGVLDGEAVPSGVAAWLEEYAAQCAGNEDATS